MILQLMNYILSSHTPTEVQGLEERFKQFSSSHLIDLPTFNSDKSLKGTGAQVCFSSSKIQSLNFKLA